MFELPFRDIHQSRMFINPQHIVCIWTDNYKKDIGHGIIEEHQGAILTTITGGYYLLDGNIDEIVERIRKAK